MNSTITIARNLLQYVKKEEWKVVFPHVYRSYKGAEPGENLHPGPYNKGQSVLELYNLSNDIGETTDVAGLFPNIVKELEKVGNLARSKLGDKLTNEIGTESYACLLYTSPSPRDATLSRMPSSA